MAKGPQRVGMRGGGRLFINVNFLASERDLYDAIKALAKQRRQPASQLMRGLAEAELGREAEAKARAEASDGSTD